MSLHRSLQIQEERSRYFGMTDRKIKLCELLLLMDDSEYIEVHDVWAATEDFVVYLGYVRDAKTSPVAKARIVAMSGDGGYMSFLIDGKE